jgi:GDSL-like Lipase/Acylhydrolase family
MQTRGIGHLSKRVLFGAAIVHKTGSRKAIRVTGSALLVIVFALHLVQAQVPPTKHVTMTGNSIAQMQGGFQPYEFPFLPAQNVVIRGQYSYTCAMLLPTLSYVVPADSDVVVLIDSTNDVLHGVAIADHVSCINQSIALLWQRNHQVKILLANTPPMGSGNCYGDFRDSIDTYNSAYRELVDSYRTGSISVGLIDVWTPSAGPDRWALPAAMTGACQIHPGPANQWTGGWLPPYFTAAITEAVKHAVH